MTASEHTLTAGCPLSCLEAQLPAKAFRALRRHLVGQTVHPTVGTAAALCRSSGLTGIRGLGAQGQVLVTRLLAQNGLLTARATPQDSTYTANQ